jgi:hypothetical protein
MGPVDPKTVIACFQLVSGGSLLGSAYHWRPASPVSKSGWLAGVISIAMGIQALTSGAVHYAAMALASICFVVMLQQMFMWRDRIGLWMSLVFSMLALPIAVAEVILDDLNGWQTAVFGGLGAVLAVLLVTNFIRLVRSYRPVTLPSA